jgi:hypothetical protein
VVDPWDSDTPEQISPIYGFNRPGGPIVLFDGLAGGVVDADIRVIVVLACAPRPSIEWAIEDEVVPDFFDRSDLTLLLRRPSGDTEVHASMRSWDDGWINGAALGSSEAPMTRLVAHWLNLPATPGTERITVHLEDGSQRWWHGRQVLSTQGWTITIDRRPDHSEVWTDLHKSDVYLMTHVMEIRRADDSAFTADDVEPVLDALHVGTSFALGRWAAPMLPVGLNAHGDIVWQQWGASHCDPAQAVDGGWWYPSDRDSLETFLTLVVRAFMDPDRRAGLRLQMMLAITATGGRGFVEPRIVNGTAGIEHLKWQTLVLDRGMPRNEYKRLDGHKTLRDLLGESGIDTAIDSALSPAIAEFVAEQVARQNVDALDGPDVVTQIRNRLVHPKESQDLVYKHDGLVAEVWLLTRHYLNLLILHSLGYRGVYRDLRRKTGWASEVTPVPWTL